MPNSFTPDEISQILEEFFKVVGTRQYIGARYVPIFGRKDETSIAWDNTAPYEPLTIVLYQGNSYTSRQYVPAGVEITNESFWALTGNYNAQIEAYRREVQDYSERIDEALDAADAAQTSADTAQAAADAAQTSADTAQAAVDVIDAKFPIAMTDLSSDTITRLESNAITSDTPFVFIGDSYGRGVGSTDAKGWVDYVISSLGITRYLNISNSGAGFVRPGHSEPYGEMTFSQQIDYASVNLPEGLTTNDIQYVVIAGGYNDGTSPFATVETAVYNCVRNAHSKFPNAKVVVLPLTVGDMRMNSGRHAVNMSIVMGAARANAMTTNQSIYWLAPYVTTTSNGDHIHPNNLGYSYLGRFISSFILGGVIGAEAWIYGTDGYQLAEGVTVGSSGFRCGMLNGFAWASGSFSRLGAGQLCTLPAYFQIKTNYFLAFYYGGTGKAGVCRMRLDQYGHLYAMTGETGTIDSNTQYEYFIPQLMFPALQIQTD